MSAARLLVCLTVSVLLFAEGQSVSLGNAFFLECSNDQFGMRSHGIIEETAAGRKFYPLPQSDAGKWLKLRPQDAKNIFPVPSPAHYERQEVIGPYQVEGDRIWFGTQYYDGEGETGVGGFGYFETETRLYKIFSPMEIADWEISALLVEPEVVWLGLDRFVEDVSKVPGGLVCWDRKTHNLSRYPLEFPIQQIRRDAKDGSRLLLETRGGYALFRDGEVERYLTQKSADNSISAIHIDHFPPQPTKY